MGIDRKTKGRERGLVAIVSLETTLETSIVEIPREFTHYRIRNGNSPTVIELYSERRRKSIHIPNGIIGMRISALPNYLSYSDLLNREQFEEAKKTARILHPKYHYE